MPEFSLSLPRGRVEDELLEERENFTFHFIYPLKRFLYVFTTCNYYFSNKIARKKTPEKSAAFLGD